MGVVPHVMAEASVEEPLLEVARAAQGLLSLLPEPRRLSPDVAKAVLVCRDAVLRELRVVLRDALGLGPAAPDPEPDLSHSTTARSLHAALAELPQTCPVELRLPEALLGHDELLRPWQAFARAAVALEGWGDAPRQSAGEPGQTVAAVAALLLTVVQLDGELGPRLPSPFAAARRRLSEQVRHGRARAAALAVLAPRSAS